MLVFYKVGIVYKVVQTESFIRKFDFLDHSICFLGRYLYLRTRSSPLFTSPLQFPCVHLRKDPSFWKGHQLESSVAGACTRDPVWLKQKGGLGLIELSGPGVSDWKGTSVLGRLVSLHLSPLLPPRVCFILSPRWWHDGARQHQASILPSSRSVAPHCDLSDCSAVDGELRLWSLIH